MTLSDAVFIDRAKKMITAAYKQAGEIQYDKELDDEFYKLFTEIDAVECSEDSRDVAGQVVDFLQHLTERTKILG